MMMDLLSSSLVEIRDAIRDRRISSEEVTRFFLDRIEKYNSKINAFISVNPQALESARQLDQRLQRGENIGALGGVPIGIKDLLCTKGIATTAASKILHNFVPPYSATVVNRLEAAGAVIIGKTNLDEFAMGSSNENSHFGKCRNPWNVEYVPGGSSGGSAAAVAARLVPGAIGTDTGGSIRQPASFCGIAGIKPTYGRVSRYGIIAFASSLDQAGPMALTARDCALMLEVISGQDPQDATSAAQVVPKFSHDMVADVTGLTIGIPKQYMSDGLHGDVRAAVQEVRRHLESRGARFVEIDLSLTEHSVPVYYLIAASEASSNLARYDGVRFGYRSDFSKHAAESLEEFYSRSRGEGFGPEVKRRIMLGTYALSSGYYDAYYRKAGQVRRLLQQEFMRAFQQCQVILGPVTTTPAFKIGERIDDPLTMYLNDIFTTSTNLAGLPGMSVPAGLSAEGLPIGVQLMAKHFDEVSIFRVAEVIGEHMQFEKKVPHV
jgi:aspartyl-tRNA(Asn)/glutamyl-tRNA(Gln) amidotransferase subunit A